jgi:hypothetical protein
MKAVIALTFGLRGTSPAREGETQNTHSTIATSAGLVGRNLESRSK